MCDLTILTYIYNSFLIMPLMLICRNTVRRTQSAALDSLYGSSKNKYIGKKNSDFMFNDLTSVKVSFIECHSTTSRDEDLHDLTQVQKWINSVV